MNEEILKGNIIKNAQYLNSLLEQELYRIEQNKSTHVSDQTRHLVDSVIKMTCLVIQVPDIDAVIQNTVG